MADFRQLVRAREVWGCTEPASVTSTRAAETSRRAFGQASELGPTKLARTIEAEVIPRLMLAHRQPLSPALFVSEENVSAADVADFADLVLVHDVTVALAFVQAVRARGTSLETVFLHLLAPTARLLGDLWREDLCSFTDVTVGLSCLQQVLRELSAPFETEVEMAQDGRRALLAPTPGEQHTFGLMMVEEFFRRAGWDVMSSVRSSADLLQLVRRDVFDLVGLSASCETRLDGMSDLIGAIRRASRNRSIGVLVGGRLFNESPDLVARVGADGTAMDGRQAVLQIPSLFGLAARRS